MIFIVDLVEYPVLDSWVVNKLPNESDLPSTFRYDCPALRYYFVNNYQIFYILAFKFEDIQSFKKWSQPPSPQRLNFSCLGQSC